MGKRKTKGANILEWFFAILISGLLILSIPVFFIRLHEVRNTELIGKLEKGDVLWIDKWKNGPRLPYFSALFPSGENGSNHASAGYTRIGSPDFHRSQIVAFNSTFPNDVMPHLRPVSLGRIIGLPGDTIKIHYGKVYINGNLLRAPNEPILHYEATLRDTNHLPEIIIKYDLKFVERPLPYEIQFAARRKNALALAGDTFITRFTRMLEMEPNPLVFPNGWPGQSADIYGPVLVPAIGDTAKSVYSASLAAHFEVDTPSLASMDTTIFPVFHHNYYFLLSDYRSAGNDSRYFGAIPEYLIIGTVGGKIWKHEQHIFGK